MEPLSVQLDAVTEASARLWMTALERLLLGVCWTFGIDDERQARVRAAVVYPVHPPPAVAMRRAHVEVDGRRVTPDLVMWLDGLTVRVGCGVEPESSTPPWVER